MRSVKKQAELPKGLAGDQCAQLTINLCQNPSDHKHNGYYYAHETVKEALQEIYGNKCAYCEGDITAVSSPRIDHFRPKNRIKEQKESLGYYWLTYEWTNLIQSCEKCNGKKSNHFPLSNENTRVASLPKLNEGGIPVHEWRNPTGPILGNEKRLLLNPEWDDVESYFYFTSDGKIHSDSEEGKTSIRIYDLNRNRLVYARKKTSDQYTERIDRYLKEYETNPDKESGLSKLLEKIEELFVYELLAKVESTDLKDLEYSAYCGFMVYEFEQFFIENSSHPKLLQKIYQKIIDQFDSHS